MADSETVAAEKPAPKKKAASRKADVVRSVVREADLPLRSVTRS